MGGDIKIRKLNKKDLPLVYRLIQNTIDFSYSGVYPPEAIEFFKDYHNKENIIKDAAAGYTIVAERDGEILGTGTLLDTNIRRVYISPSYQHRGIGKLIVQELERKALLKKLSTLDLEGNIVSRQFWEAMGFTIREECFLMVKNNRKLHYYVMVKKNGM